MILSIQLFNKYLKSQIYSYFILLLILLEREEETKEEKKEKAN